MVLTDTVGTENSFKKLSGTYTDVIHIATHGFYWTEKEAYTSIMMSLKISVVEQTQLIQKIKH